VSEALVSQEPKTLSKENPGFHRKSNSVKCLFLLNITMEFVISSEYTITCHPKRLRQCGKQKGIFLPHF
jgi:hypothetical protein